MQKVTTKKKMKAIIAKQWGFYWLILGLPLLQFCLFYIGALVNSVLLPFQKYDYDVGGMVWDTTFSNLQLAFSDLFTKSYFKHALKNSTVLYVTGTVVGTTLALLFSYYIYKKRFGSEFFKTVLFMPQIVSGVTMVIMYRYFVDRGIPTIYEFFSGTEIEGLIANPQTSFATILFFSIWAGFGTQILMYSGAMNGIDDSAVEAARLDGVNTFQEFYGHS